MTIVTVTGTILKPDGTPWENAAVKFRLHPGSQINDQLFPSNKLTVRTDEYGDFAIDLWANDEGDFSSEYSVQLPSGETHEFILPEGDESQELTDLIVLYVGPSDPSYAPLSAYVDEAVQEEEDAREAADTAEALTRATADSAEAAARLAADTVGSFGVTAANLLASAALAFTMLLSPDTLTVPEWGKLTDDYVAADAAIAWSKLGEGDLPDDRLTNNIPRLDALISAFANDVTIGGDLTVTGAIDGNAATATALETARNINGISFDGTTDIVLTATDVLGAAAAGSYLRGTAGQPDWAATVFDGGGAVFNAHNEGFAFATAATPAARSAAFQTVIAAAAAAGSGVVSITQAGTYDFALVDGGADIDRCLTINASNVTLYVGPGVELRLAAGQLSGSATGHIIQIGDGVTELENVTIVGEGTINGQRASNVSSTSTSGACGIKVDGPIRNLRVSVGIQDITGAAFRQTCDDPGDSIGTWFEGCRIKNCGEGVVFQNVYNFWCNGNDVDTIVNGDALEASSECFNWEICGNRIRACSESCIDIYNGPTQGKVNGNFIDQTGIVGVIPAIMIHGAHAGAGDNETNDVECNGNTITNAPSHAINFEPGAGGTNARLSACGNTIITPGGCGLRAGDDDGEILTFVRFNDNTISGAANQSILTIAHYSETDNNRATGGASQGIEIGSDSFTVLGGTACNNRITLMDGDGIKITAADDLEVTNNVCWNNGQSGSSTSAGIKLLAGNNNRLAVNNCYDDQAVKTQQYGVRITGGASTNDTIVRWNRFRGHGTAAVSDAGTNTIRRDNDGDTSPQDPYTQTQVDALVTTLNTSITNETGNAGTKGVLIFVRMVSNTAFADNVATDLFTFAGATNRRTDIEVRYHIYRSDTTSPGFSEKGAFDCGIFHRGATKVVDAGAKLWSRQILEGAATVSVAMVATEGATNGSLKLTVTVDNNQSTGNVGGFFEVRVTQARTSTSPASMNTARTDMTWHIAEPA